MARRFSSTGSKASAANTTYMSLASAATIRPVLHEIIFGSATAPADNAMRIQLVQMNASGTGSAVTPQAWDPADPASLATATQGLTVEPTYTSEIILLEVPTNQQTTWRWVVPPEEGLVAPALAANGWGLRCYQISGGTPTCQVTLTHEE